jgi:para-aminobenzoate synthetase / 4-amino-4-deoxychorismate lyase
MTVRGGVGVDARFDSLDPARGAGSYLFRRPTEVVEAWEKDEVVPALRRVEKQVARGRHAAGFLAYEAGAAFDPAFANVPAGERFPLLLFGIFESRQAAAPTEVPAGGYALGPATPSISAEAYRRDVERILDLIAAGDTYQVNYTFRLEGEFRGADDALYHDLCHAQRAAFCALIRFGDVSLVSASPELFFRRLGSRIELRPMKGTRPRGRWSEEDEALAEELVTSAKERAENLMIVDLLRNDVGRVAEFGSVRVPTLFEVERYPTVHQMTSTIEATLREDAGLVEIFHALFPSGSVTGAPKLRTSEIIRDLEGGPRGPYTGAIGFVSPDQAVFSVAIRTLRVDRARGRYQLGVGSGITSDSDPAAEYRECIGKGAFVHHRVPEFRLLESLRFERPGGFPLLPLHLARLARSARYFGFPLEEGRVQSALEMGTDPLGEGLYKVRLRVDRSGRPDVEVEPIARVSAPVRLGLARTPVDDADPFLYHKTTHREAYAARLAERPDCDDVLLFNTRGELTESTTANLVLEIGGEWLTPPVSSGLLPGVAREELLSSGRVVVRPLELAHLRRADRVYLVNAVRGRREAVLLD